VTTRFDVIPLWPAHLPAQRLVLMTQHQEFNLLEQVRPKQYRQKAD
jgi:hypothetical protein